MDLVIKWKDHPWKTNAIERPNLGQADIGQAGRTAELHRPIVEEYRTGSSP
ncbi:MAG: hypothetical protein MUC43_03110 [Pirellula sp.]|nr:hypothetical protein [Pirellula sp.]